MRGKLVNMEDMVNLPDPVHRITVRPCILTNGKLVKRGDSKTMSLFQAMECFAPTRSKEARKNVACLRTGDYIGVNNRGNNFVISNPTRDGDIRWLLAKKPSAMLDVNHIHVVEDIDIKRSRIDLPVLVGG